MRKSEIKEEKEKKLTHTTLMGLYLTVFWSTYSQTDGVFIGLGERTTLSNYI